jgi:hypothetical protein
MNAIPVGIYRNFVSDWINLQKCSRLLCVKYKAFNKRPFNMSRILCVCACASELRLFEYSTQYAFRRISSPSNPLQKETGVDESGKTCVLRRKITKKTVIVQIFVLKSYINIQNYGN